MSSTVCSLTFFTVAKLPVVLNAPFFTEHTLQLMCNTAKNYANTNISPRKWMFYCLILQFQGMFVCVSRTTKDLLHSSCGHLISFMLMQFFKSLVKTDLHWGHIVPQEYKLHDKQERDSKQTYFLGQWSMDFVHKHKLPLIYFI